MSKSLIFRIAVIVLIWILMVKAGFGIFLTLLAVFVTFATLSLFLFVIRMITGVAGRFRR